METQEKMNGTVEKLRRIDAEILRGVEEEIQKPVAALKTERDYPVVALLDEPSAIDENYETTKALLGILREKLDSAEYHSNRLDELIKGYKCLIDAEEAKLKLIEEFRKSNTW